MPPPLRHRRRRALPPPPQRLQCPPADLLLEYMTLSVGTAVGGGNEFVLRAGPSLVSAVGIACAFGAWWGVAIGWTINLNMSIYAR